jgi:hypothetical protein
MKDGGDELFAWGARWSSDHFGNREDGAQAALEAEGDFYKLAFGMAVGHLVSRADFTELVSTDVTDLIGLPGGSPGHRSGLVAALTPLSAKAYGLVPGGLRKSRDKRHKHALTFWVKPDRGVEIDL